MTTVLTSLRGISCLSCSVRVAQSCAALCNPMNCSPPGSSIHGIFQARVLEWFAISFSRGSSWIVKWFTSSFTRFPYVIYFVKSPLMAYISASYRYEMMHDWLTHLGISFTISSYYYPILIEWITQYRLWINSRYRVYKSSSQAIWNSIKN